jgi:hypothetical protein
MVLLLGAVVTVGTMPSGFGLSINSGGRTGYVAGGAYIYSIDLDSGVCPLVFPRLKFRVSSSRWMILTACYQSHSHAFSLYS